MAIIGGIPHFQTYPNFGMGWNGMWLWVSLNAAVPWMENPLNGIFQLAMLDYWRDLEGNFMFCVYIYIIYVQLSYIYIYIIGKHYTHIYIFTYASLRMLCIYIYTHKTMSFFGQPKFDRWSRGWWISQKGVPANDTVYYQRWSQLVVSGRIFFGRRLKWVYKQLSWVAWVCATPNQIFLLLCLCVVRDLAITQDTLADTEMMTEIPDSKIAMDYKLCLNPS